MGTEDRLLAWKKAIKNGELFKNPSESPQYDSDKWIKQLHSMQKAKNSQVAVTKNAYKFYQAAAIHRNYVLNTLLPKYGIVVSQR